jgi:phosphoglycerate dehydrogenase-like enzyme
MLVHSHSYPLLYEWQKAHHWASNTDHNRLSSITDRVGMRIGILGYGSIGRQVARVCTAMGMTILAYTASPRATPESRKDDGYIVAGTGDPEGIYPSAWYSGTSTADLHNFLSQDLDHLLISLPLTPATTHLLSAPEFSILSKRKTFITNISRGAILHQSDLVEALKSGQLRGAALDVADPEPLPKDDPLWDAPNLVITPHISGLGVEYMGRAFEVLELNLKRREEGRGMVNVVDRERGY